MTHISGVWKDLDWAKKVQICQEFLADEDSWLHTYVVIFIALQVMFFAIVFGLKLHLWGVIAIAIVAILVAIWFIYIFYVRGNAVDRWGEIMYKLFTEVDQQELPAQPELLKHYKGSLERRERKRKKCGWLYVIFGWGCNPWNWIKSARRVLGTYTPLLACFAWIFLVIYKIN